MESQKKEVAACMVDICLGLRNSKEKIVSLG